MGQSRCIKRGRRNIIGGRIRAVGDDLPSSPAKGVRAVLLHPPPIHPLRDFLHPPRRNLPLLQDSPRFLPLRRRSLLAILTVPARRPPRLRPCSAF
ncbi:hypothetical protein U1Q18_003620 [Sarracenia purpurea var. burkii]